MKKALIITSIVFPIFTFAAAGEVWYLMDQRAKENKKTFEVQKTELENRIANVNSAKKETTTTPSKNDLEDIKSVCAQPAVSEVSLKQLAYVWNQNGEFANCSIGGGGGGAMIILKKINDQWTKIWSGNGSMSDTEILKYKVPSTIYPHNLNVN
ncbi:MAG: hypothetical protein M1355_01185 [Patescibacteria group bacterium]|nr:hypothetical protein [Patescibacteria group bacterium]